MLEYLIAGLLALVIACCSSPQPPPPAMSSPAQESTAIPTPVQMMQVVLENSWHGDATLDPYNYPLMYKKVISGEKISISCGPMTYLAVYVLSQYYKARLVNTITLDTWNNFDDGHNLTEVLENGQWVLYDFDNHVQPLVDGQPATLDQVIHNLGAVTLLPLYGGSTVDPAYLVEWPLAWAEIFSSILSWYDRIMQVQLYTDSSGVVYYSDSRQTKVESLEPKANYLPRAEFLQLVYGQEE